MSSEKLRQIVEQHGEAAEKFVEKAVQVGDAYIIQDFNFSPETIQTLDEILAPRRDIDFGVPDIRIFAKPKGFELFSSNEEDTETEILDLVDYLSTIYPDNYPYYASMPDWWTEEDMISEAEVFHPMDLAIWMLDHLRPESDEEESLINAWLSSLKSVIGDEVTVYKFEDDGDANCAFAPYLFEGKSCLILAIRYWAYL